jgi:4-amino-4-deoxy-L-arabinose transferase-like glycosyltransferase
MRPDFFLLADAFLHGRTWVDPAMLQQPWDRIDVDGRTYVAFAPLPAILMVPFVAVFGVTALAPREAIVNAALGGLCVALCWRLVARYDSGRLADRFWIVALFALSTPLWWVVTLGGVWHTGQLAATCMTLLALLEATKRRRPWVLGLLGGAAFLARFPTLLALPFYAWLAMAQRGVPKVRVPTTPELGRGALAVVGFLPAALFDAWYNLVRFGAPLETGYRLATTAPFLQPELMKGLFSVRHLGRNLDFLLWHLPKMDGGPPRPDGFGLSVLVTSPGLLLALNADWKDPLMRWAAITGLVVLLPSLFWWGGGWYQLGFRYLLDALPFIMLPVASGARNGVSTAWKALIVFGGLVSVWGIYSFLNVPIPVPQ